MEWTPTHEEMAVLREELAKKLSLVQVAGKFTNTVEEVSSGRFSHRCICPNPAHKNGQERNPSFFISEEEEFFRCWGCGFHGDVFDLLERMNGTPGDILALKFAKKEDLDLAKLLENKTFKVSPKREIRKLNLRISHDFRKYLKNLEGTEAYEEEKKWADHTFKNIDTRFSKISKDLVAARNYYRQVMLELERRKL